MPTKAHPPKSSSKTPDIYARRIISTNSQHVEVLACPGSGKTTTLIWRAQGLLDRGEPARQITILSFGNAAVREIRHRMDGASTSRDARSSGRKLGKSTVATAHAFALSMFKRRPSVMSEPQQLQLVAQAVRRIRKLANQHKLLPNADDAKLSRRRACLAELSAKTHRDRLLQLFDFVRARQIGVREALTLPMFASLPRNAVVIKAVIEQYDGLKRERRLIDFADMLEQATTRVLAGRVKLKVKHLLIDEFQDCSAAQSKFFAAIATHCRASIMAFGDPRQSIYGFAGAAYQSLGAVLPDVKSLSLPRSWRLTHETAALASALDQGREHPPILGTRSGTRPVLCLSTSETQQARHVVADIQRLLRDGVAIDDIVVLARNRATLRTVEAALLAAGIDSSNVGTKRSDRHVLNVLRLVWWASRARRAGGRPMTAEMLRLLDIGGLAIGKAKAVEQARLMTRGPWGAKLEGRFAICAKAYLRLLGGIRQDSELAATINRWLPMTRSCTGPKQLRDMILAHRSTSALQTSTIHSAKGREWRHVLLVGATEGVLPDYRSLGELELDQERNVLFVGITRAMKSLRMYHAPTVNPRSRRRHHLPSNPLTNASKLEVYDVLARMHEN
jgi:DNA helicase-2/ATP-dependent DNA helicase PcrA